jgi:RNA polymerase sigma-70 factor (ECF subfamily)
VLAAMEGGDRRRALALLMDAYGTAVYRFCRAALGDPAAADDALQTVFLEAYESLPRFARRSTLLTWLLGIARHRCLDAAKARQRWRLRFFGGSAAAAGEPADPDPGAEQALAERARSSFVLDCLKQLPAEVRMAVILRCQEGLSYEDMSRMSRERAGTLQARVSRALPVLRA